MSYRLDSELAAAMAALAQRAAAGPVTARGDWKTMRRLGEAGQAYLASLTPPSSNVKISTYRARTDDGASIELRWYTKTGSGPDAHCASKAGPAVVFAHGGGMVLGTLDLYNQVVSWYVDQTAVPFLSVGYRRAPDEGTGTMLAEDVFTRLTWLLQHAEEHGVDPARIAVMGDSGGGAPTAAAAIMARDRDLPLARQILIYPMLDDRNQTPDPTRAAYLTWNYDDNFTAWHAVLGDGLGTDTVSPLAAPARLTDFTGLAPAYLDVGDLDIFRDEVIAYAARPAATGVPLELHVHRGVPHGWERFAPAAGSARRAMNDRARTIASL